MPTVERKNLDTPDETRSFDKGKIEVVNIGGGSVGRMTLQPGWKWSESVKPIVGTPSCQVSHVNYVIAGRLHVMMDDGTELEVSPGDAVAVPPGHDAWVIGTEPVVMLEVSGAAQYATPQA